MSGNVFGNSQINDKLLRFLWIPFDVISWSSLLKCYLAEEKGPLHIHQTSVSQSNINIMLIQPLKFSLTIMSNGKLPVTTFFCIKINIDFNFQSSTTQASVQVK